ncbi:MAG: FG-GAP-like repeat-containing protein [Myxococcota bacterium]
MTLCAPPRFPKALLAWRLTPSALVLGCGGGGEQTTTQGADDGINTLTASDTEMGDGTTGVDSTSTGADETAECPEAQQCDAECCDQGYSCVDGTCVIACADQRDPCGEAQICCAEADVCWFGDCVTPGAPCAVSGCATQPIMDTCDIDEICEPTIGACVPSQMVGECTYEPPAAQFDPTPLFSWGQRRERACTVDADCQTSEVCMAGVCEVTWTHRVPTTEPDFSQVMSVPAVVDLDQDCVPELIFNTYAPGNLDSGLLRVIRGDDGTDVWTFDDPAHRLDGGSSPAVGDLDGDGTPEIVAKGTGSFLVAVAADGSLLWESDSFQGNTSRGSAAIANIDAEGLAEVIYGAAVYDANGARVWEGNAGVGINGSGPLSCVADLDDDGRPELIAGDTAYTFSGSVAGGNFDGSSLWQGSLPGDGFCGIADFTGDGAPEVALVASGTIYVLEGPTGAVLAEVDIPGGGNGGAPNIADFDGDGTPDIGTAGASRYVVVGYDGDDTLEIFWQAQTEDDSSNRTGSSVFDFDGDGRSEVVYNDEEFLRIYPGVEPDCDLPVPGPACDGVMTDDELVFRDLSSSRTDTEYPVVADVDGDFKAELIIINNNEAGHLDPNLITDAGIEVWDDRLDNWVATRPVWNQHSYHVTNVGTVGEIPMVEDASWTANYNGYRRNAQGDLATLCAPDLVPYGLDNDSMQCPDLALSVFVLNQGCLGVGPGVNVAFYEQDLGLLGVVQTTAALPAGGSELVTLDVPFDAQSVSVVTAVVDDDGSGMSALNECAEDNNESDPLEACQQIG